MDVDGGLFVCSRGETRPQDSFQINIQRGTEFVPGLLAPRLSLAKLAASAPPSLTDAAEQTSV